MALIRDGTGAVGEMVVDQNTLSNAQRACPIEEAAVAAASGCIVGNDATITSW